MIALLETMSPVQQQLIGLSVVRDQIARKHGCSGEEVPPIDPYRWNVDRLIEQTEHGFWAGLCLAAAIAGQAIYESEDIHRAIARVERIKLSIAERYLPEVVKDRQARTELSVGVMPEGNFGWRAYQQIRMVIALAEFQLELTRAANHA